MVSNAAFRKLALSFPNAEEHPHFEKASFRLKKKIFSTLWESERKAMLKLSLVDQSVFCSFDNTIFYPVPGAWGKQGATFVSLARVPAAMLRDALKQAYGQLTISKGKRKI